ncbi:hypothetical protein [Streptomyces sp. CB03238]|uniref:hypothetical protein n=1 Tax=Streptomyces sp. CB03238 TaxID=1907777 RepID=UPI000A117B53|nr:hypothetical protein [Streptomyces sp. CB03238]ORT54285.1 hypothetical protein BKD26_35805 [Streptomyces sp. CB03238]
MSGTWWVNEAPCAGDRRFTPDDANEDSFRAPQIRMLLAVCQDCPFRARCIDLVLPRQSLFDGICGGRLWIDGTVRATCEGAHHDELEEGAAPITHGTEAGARAHNRRGETACSLCREAGRLAQQARRARKRASGS